jgi:hypothetical protein
MNIYWDEIDQYFDDIEDVYEYIMDAEDDTLVNLASGISLFEVQPYIPPKSHAEAITEKTLDYIDNHIPELVDRNNDDRFFSELIRHDQKKMLTELLHGWLKAVSNVVMPDYTKPITWNDAEWQKYNDNWNKADAEDESP